MPLDVSGAITAVWITIGIVWAIGAVVTKRTRRTEAARSRVVHTALATVAFFLLFSARARLGPLAWRFVPESQGAAYAGLALTIAGAAFAIWARLFLGGNWSSSVTVKEDHKLVRTGPYSLVRHPIYSGGLLAIAGTALAVGEARGLLALILAFRAWRLKSKVEEGFMIEQFGAEYEEYERQVKALIPFVL
jgi:protein-S-isoprenylcysteine O-methyltransferase Ste14